MNNPPQFPWLKWFPRDFASSTRGWPLVARAVYRELLDAQWDIGGSGAGVLPDDDLQLRELARASVAEWKVAWRFVSRKFPRVAAGGRQNARLEEHRKAAISEFQARRKGARKTNAKRWGGDRSAIGQRSLSDYPSDRSATNERLATSSSSSAREDEDVRLVGIRVTGKRLVRLPCDCRRRQAPAETERSVTVATVVRQRQRRPETAAPWARRNRDTERARARDGVRRELLADAANGAAALRHRDGREATDGSRALSVDPIARR